MKVELNITGTAQACNEWIFATATDHGKEYRIMMVRFEEPSNYGIRQGRIIAGSAIILGGNGNRFKALPENLAFFEMMTEWIEPKDVPPPRQTLISIL